MRWSSWSTCMENGRDSKTWFNHPADPPELREATRSADLTPPVGSRLRIWDTRETGLETHPDNERGGGATSGAYGTGLSASSKSSTSPPIPAVHMGIKVKYAASRARHWEESWP